MLILTILKNIFDIKKIVGEIYKLYKFLRKNKILNTWTVIGLVVSIFLFYICYIKFIMMLDQEYNRDVKLSKIENEIDNHLKACGDKTAISVSSVSTNKDPTDQFYNARITKAKVCDFEVNQKNCIFNLIDINDIYRGEKQIDLSTYELLESISNQDFPRYFPLSQNGIQNIEQTAKYYFINTILKQTIWYERGILNSLRVVSIVKYIPFDDRKVIYVITLMIGNKTSSCIPDRELQELKQFIQNL